MTASEGDAQCWRELAESYQLLVPRLQAQVEAARRGAPCTCPCPSVSRMGKRCDLIEGHAVPHMHRGDTVDWSWGP